MKPTVSRCTMPPKGNASRKQKAVAATQESINLSKERAKKIFYMMIERNCLSPESFIQQAVFINPEIYDDIVLERAISRVCGYPMCKEKFDDKYGDRQWIIRANKVYDITDRKSFCSDVCYEASCIVRSQISTAPLYIRDSDSFKEKSITVPDKNSLKGLHGMYVDISGNNPLINEELSSKSFTSIMEVVQEGLLNCAENAQDEARPQQPPKRKESEERTKSKNQDYVRKKCEKEVTTDKSDPFAGVHEVEKALREWMSFESLRVILGDRYVQGMLEAMGKKWSDYNTVSGMTLEVNAKRKYIQICKKLDMQEHMDEMIQDEEESEDSIPKPQQAVPDYEQLEKDSKNQEYKVIAFLGGSDHYEELSEPKANERRGGKKSKKQQETPSDSAESTIPLVDSVFQAEWREVILLEKAEVYLQNMIATARLNKKEVMRLLRELVVTFNLSAHNITFKSGQWNLIAIILMKMLSVRYMIIKESIENEEVLKVVQAILGEFNLDLNYLDRILSYLTEIGYIIAKSSSTQQTNRKGEKNPNISSGTENGEVCVGSGATRQEQELSNEIKHLKL